MVKNSSYCIFSTIDRDIWALPLFAPQSLPNHSLIALWSNPASVYPPIFDTPDLLDMQTGIPLSGILKLCSWASSMPQRLKTWTLLQRQSLLIPFPFKCIKLQKYFSLKIHQDELAAPTHQTWNLLSPCWKMQVPPLHLNWHIHLIFLHSPVVLSHRWRTWYHPFD